MKEEIVDSFISDVREIYTIDEFERKVQEIKDYFSEEGENVQLRKVGQVASFSKNKFSKINDADRLEKAKRSLCDYLRSLKDEAGAEISDASVIVNTVLENFKDVLECMFYSTPHGKCGGSIREMCADFCIENEYDLQHLLYPIIRAFFPLARTEEWQDAGNVAYRKDICIDESNIAIELKCTRSGMTERSLSDEIAADIVHYNEKNLFFWIYDKANVISNVNTFIKANESIKIDKNIRIFVEKSIGVVD